MMSLIFHPSKHYELIAQLDKECFPLDVPAEYETANWFVGWLDGNAVAFCGWKRFIPDFLSPKTMDIGFLYRAGVLPQARGQRIQRQMIQLREIEMELAGCIRSVTYTDADAAYSMRNLIAEGYLPYIPVDGPYSTRLSGPPDRLGRVGFVHWEKDLT